MDEMIKQTIHARKNAIYDTYDVDKNKRAYKRYAPFKLNLDE